MGRNYDEFGRKFIYGLKIKNNLWINLVYICAKYSRESKVLNIT